jgi:hypothetical protein
MRTLPALGIQNVCCWGNQRQIWSACLHHGQSLMWNTRRRTDMWNPISRGLFIFVNLLTLMLNIIFCGRKLLGFKLITLNTFHCVFIVDLLLLIIHTIELLLNTFVIIYNNFVNIYRIEDFSNKPYILSIQIKIKYTQYIVEVLTTILHLPAQAYRVLKLLYTYPSIYLHNEEFATFLCTGDGRRSNYCFNTTVHHVVMGQWGPKHIEVCASKYFCN